MGSASDHLVLGRVLNPPNWCGPEHLPITSRLPVLRSECRPVAQNPFIGTYLISLLKTFDEMSWQRCRRPAFGHSADGGGRDMRLRIVFPSSISYMASAGTFVNS